MDSPNDPWFTCLAPCVSLLPCGQGRHVVRWEAGELRLAGHDDPEAELVLAALGGGKARCIEVAEAWGRHAADLTVLGIGPRSPADEIAVGWDDVDSAAQAGLRGMLPSHRPGRLANPPVAAIARASARHAQLKQEAEQAGRRRDDMLSLFALGYGFQVRLIGHVVAAHAARPGPGSRPALAAALAGRLAPVAEQWLGIDPGQVKVTLRGERGWGSVELTGHGAQRRLQVSLPAAWLARVWVPGLALVGRHLVVAVPRAGWPDAQVLALRAPGAEPVLLDVHAGGDPSGARDVPHWTL